MSKWLNWACKIGLNAWARIICSWTRPRRSSCGAALVSVSINCRFRQSLSVKVVHPASVMRDLGVWIDRSLSMSTTMVVLGSYAVLRQLDSIRRSVNRESLIGLVMSLVLTRLDYCNMFGAYYLKTAGDTARLGYVWNNGAPIGNDIQSNGYVIESQHGDLVEVCALWVFFFYFLLVLFR